MWKCIFDSETGKGVAFGREAQEGEFKVELPPSECAWFNSTPERYQYADGIFSERPEWEQEQQFKELEQAVTQKFNEIIVYNDKKDMEPIPFNGELYKNTKAVPETIRACELMGQEDTDPIFVNNGMWDNYNNTNSTPFTLGDLKELYKTGYNICAVHCAVAKYHVAVMSSLTDIEEIKNYDYTIGWDGSILP
jgi:hypothetical protein